MMAMKIKNNNNEDVPDECLQLKVTTKFLQFTETCVNTKENLRVSRIKRIEPSSFWFVFYCSINSIRATGYMTMVDNVQFTQFIWLNKSNAAYRRILLGNFQSAWIYSNVEMEEDQKSESQITSKFNIKKKK